MQQTRKLKVPAPDTCRQITLRKELGISTVLAQILINRGITSVEDAAAFLNTSQTGFHDPYSFSDMAKAVALIRQAVNAKQKIMVFGDYDVDGITATALLKEMFLKMGQGIAHYLPHRVKEGYGLAKNIVEIVKNNGVKLLITVDCGTGSFKEIAALRRAGIEVIVTDHHEPQDNQTPPASAVINPKLKGANYKYRDLAGVGVAYKLCQAIAKDSLVEELDLVSLGTIADVVPLTGENRLIARLGLAQLSSTKRPGLQALIEASSLRNKKINSTFVSYILGPRINASGRMDSAETALKLLLSQDKKEAQELAIALEAFNRQRQKVEGKIMEEAQGLIGREVNFKDHRVIVIANDGWHHGVLGIIASKLADRYYRPAVVISLVDGLCKGSGRSIKNFHLFNALLDCKDCLDGFGGHGHAAGLTIMKEKIGDFRQKINALARERLSFDDLLPCLDIDMELSLSELSRELINELSGLEPFGTGNPEPLFVSRNLKLKGDVRVLGRDTIKFWVTDTNSTYQAIGFGMSDFKAGLLEADSLELVYSPKIDNWQGNDNIILEVKDMFLKPLGKSPF